MATKAKRKLPREQPLPEAPKGDWRDLAERIAENPLLYVGAGIFIIIAATSGWLIRVYQNSVNQDFATEYAQAFDADDKAGIISALEPLAEQKHEALYMLGETAYTTGDFETAKDAFTRMRQDHPDSPFVADSVEGLGFIAENNADYDEAKRLYQDVIDNWPKSFAAKRQQFNIGRCEEAAGNPEAAIDAYRAQTLAFPNSRVATRANSLMAQLQAKLGPVETETDSELQNALNAVLESTADTEESDPIEPEITEMPEQPEESIEIDDAIETPPTIAPQKLELTLPKPGEGAGAVEVDEAESP